MRRSLFKEPEGLSLIPEARSHGKGTKVHLKRWSAIRFQRLIGSSELGPFPIVLNLGSILAAAAEQVARIGRGRTNASSVPYTESSSPPALRRDLEDDAQIGAKNIHGGNLFTATMHHDSTDVCA